MSYLEAFMKGMKSVGRELPEWAFSDPKALSAASNIGELLSRREGLEEDVLALGGEVPEERKPGALSRIFGIMDMPGTFTRSLFLNLANEINKAMGEPQIAVSPAYLEQPETMAQPVSMEEWLERKTPSSEEPIYKVDPFEETARAWRGEDRFSGADIVESLGVEKGWGQFLGGLGLEILLDPLTYSSFGLNKATKLASLDEISRILGTGVDASKLAKLGVGNVPEFAKLWDEAPELVARITKTAASDIPDVKTALAILRKTAKPDEVVEQLFRRAQKMGAVDELGEGAVQDLLQQFVGDLSSLAEEIPEEISEELVKRYGKYSDNLLKSLAESDEVEKLLQVRRGVLDVSEDLMPELSREIATSRFSRDQISRILQDVDRLEDLYPVAPKISELSPRFQRGIYEQTMSSVGARMKDYGGVKLFGKTVVPMQPTFNLMSRQTRKLLNLPGIRGLTTVFDPTAPLIQGGRGQIEQAMAARMVSGLVHGSNVGRQFGVRVGEDILEELSPKMRHLLSFAVEEVLPETTRDELVPLFRQLSEIGEKIVKASDEDVFGVGAEGLRKLLNDQDVILGEIRMIVAANLNEGAIRNFLTKHAKALGISDEVEPAVRVAGQLREAFAASRQADILAGIPTKELFGAVPEGMESAGYVYHMNAAPFTTREKLSQLMGQPVESLSAQQQVIKEITGASIDELSPLPRELPFKLRRSAALPREPRPRELMTLREWIAEGYLPETDIALTSGIKLAKDEINRAKMAFVEEVSQTFGFPLAKRGQIPLEDFDILSFKRGGERVRYAVPKGVRDMVENVQSAFSTNRDVNLLVQNWDKMLNFWRRMATVWNPMFHARNFPSNYLLAWIKDARLAEPGGWIEAYSALIKYRGGPGLDDIAKKFGGLGPDDLGKPLGPDDLPPGGMGNIPETVQWTGETSFEVRRPRYKPDDYSIVLESNPGAREHYRDVFKGLFPDVDEATIDDMTYTAMRKRMFEDLDFGTWGGTPPTGSKGGKASWEGKDDFLKKLDELTTVDRRQFVKSMAGLFGKGPRGAMNIFEEVSKEHRPLRLILMDLSSLMEAAAPIHQDSLLPSVAFGYVNKMARKMRPDLHGVDRLARPKDVTWFDEIEDARELIFKALGARFPDIPGRPRAVPWQSVYGAMDDAIFSEARRILGYKGKAQTLEGIFVDLGLDPMMAEDVAGAFTYGGLTDPVFPGYEDIYSDMREVLEKMGITQETEERLVDLMEEVWQFNAFDDVLEDLRDQYINEGDALQRLVNDLNIDVYNPIKHEDLEKIADELNKQGYAGDIFMRDVRDELEEVDLNWEDVLDTVYGRDEEWGIAGKALQDLDQEALMEELFSHPDFISSLPEPHRDLLKRIQSGKPMSNTEVESWTRIMDDWASETRQGKLKDEWDRLDELRKQAQEDQLKLSEDKWPEVDLEPAAKQINLKARGLEQARAPSRLQSWLMPGTPAEGVKGGAAQAAGWEIFDDLPPEIKLSVQPPDLKHSIHGGIMVPGKGYIYGLDANNWYLNHDEIAQRIIGQPVEIDELLERYPGTVRYSLVNYTSGKKLVFLDSGRTSGIGPQKKVLDDLLDEGMISLDDEVESSLVSLEMQPPTAGEFLEGRFTPARGSKGGMAGGGGGIRKPPGGPRGPRKSGPGVPGRPERKPEFRGKEVRISDDEIITQEELVLQAIEDGAIKGYMSKAEIGRSTLRELQVQQRRGPLKYASPTYSGGTVGEIVEDGARLAVYLNARRSGMGRKAAAELCDNTLYNYAPEALTVFERQYMRRLIPFYVWLRRNLPNMAQNLVKQPGKFMWLEHARSSAFATTPVDKAAMPEWMQDLYMMPLPITDDDGNPVMWNPNIPQQDLQKLDAVFLKPGGIRDFFSALNPVVKIVFEQGLNRDVFFGTEIDQGIKVRAPAILQRIDKQLAGEPFWEEFKQSTGMVYHYKDDGSQFLAMSPRMVKLIRDMSPWLNNINKVLDDRERTPYDRLAFFTGVKTVPLDVERAQESRIYDQINELVNARRELNKQQPPKEDAVEQWLRMRNNETEPR